MSLRVDISMFNVRVYDVNYVDVLLGQKFTLQAQSDTQFNWFSNNDAILSMNVSGNTAEIGADKVGNSTILLMDSSMKIIKQLEISVVELMLPAADKLVLSVDPAQPK